MWLSAALCFIADASEHHVTVTLTNECTVVNSVYIMQCVCLCMCVRMRVCVCVMVVVHGGGGLYTVISMVTSSGYKECTIMPVVVCTLTYEI